jgi:hypothetical protein
MVVASDEIEPPIFSNISSGEKNINATRNPSFSK